MVCNSVIGEWRVIVLARWDLCEYFHFTCVFTVGIDFLTWDFRFVVVAVVTRFGSNFFILFAFGNSLFVYVNLD